MRGKFIVILRVENPKNRQVKQNMTKNGCTYILTNQYNTTLYIGVTSNLPKRIREHKNHVVDGFTKKYNIDKLVYYEAADDIMTAITRKNNKEWKDLYDSII